MLTIEQIRAGRALLDWSQSDLADHAGLSQTGIARIENGTNQPNTKTLQKILEAFDSSDIEFIGNSGVKKRTGEVKTLTGEKGFKAFMDDVYETLKNGGEMCVSNVDEQNWIKWMGKEAYDAHSIRMHELGDQISSRILVKEGDTFFIASDFAHYKWFPEELFNEQSFYAYADKLALVNFEQDTVKIMILNQKEFSESFKVLFDIAWKTVAKDPLELGKKAV